MEDSVVHQILASLKNGEISHYEVEKEQFLSFRKVLVNSEDFKHFRGTAQHGGRVVYEYTEEPRS
ncbi:hypothetical protein GJU40_08995 [Bacillus lacus]|uniref:Abortive phage infection protein n=1 Tax=Metabacillus lacus TaxID=1983721 RepID=A0A7X2IYS8_9BACI|nr:hypothetical protein [Metabacillus lacus]MRX72287.1 hypothetical protein [Metabacillus lacus]